MIEHIRTIGFKGFEIDEQVPEKVIYCGKNRSGKSTRAAAIALAIYGYIPFSTSGKRPSDIMNSYGSNNSLVVAIIVNGAEFVRKFTKNDAGSVSQSLQVNKKKVSSQNYAVELQKAGAPSIANVTEFMQQSEQKKIDTLFDLFPVNSDLNSLDVEIEESKSKISKHEKHKTATIAVIQRLTNSKQDHTVPSGSLAETKKQIEDTDTKINEIKESIKQAEIEEAREKAKKDAEKEAEDKRLADKEKKEVTESNNDVSKDDGIIHTETMSHELNRTDIPGLGSEVLEQRGDVNTESGVVHDPAASIQRIIGALKDSGCSVCAAMIVAKQELKKYNRS